MEHIVYFLTSITSLRLKFETWIIFIWWDQWSARQATATRIEEPHQEDVSVSPFENSVRCCMMNMNYTRTMWWSGWSCAGPTDAYCGSEIKSHITLILYNLILGFDFGVCFWFEGGVEEYRLGTLWGVMSHCIELEHSTWLDTGSRTAGENFQYEPKPKKWKWKRLCK